MFDSGDPYLGIVLGYDGVQQPVSERIDHRKPGGSSSLASGLVGAGRFASGVLLPAARAAGFGPWIRITSASGSSAVGWARATDSEAFVNRRRRR